MSDADDPFLCPHCKTEELNEILERNTPFLGCTTCFGLFVSVEDLASYVAKATEGPVGDAFRDLLGEATRGKGTPGKRKCPDCGAALERRGFGESPFVVIDVCADEHGIWLDKKELKKVLRSSRAHAIVKDLIPMTRKYHAIDEDDESKD